MRAFRLLSDPYPEYEEPAFVKEAYPGLRLVASWAFEPGQDEYVPHGAYMVRIPALLSAIREQRDARVHNYFAAQYGVYEDTVRPADFGILLPFPFPACTEAEH